MFEFFLLGLLVTLGILSAPFLFAIMLSIIIIGGALLLCVIGYTILFLVDMTQRIYKYFRGW